jgi:hypothetical protein
VIGTIDELVALREKVKKDPKRKRASSLYYGTMSRERERKIRNTMFIYADSEAEQKVKRSELTCVHCKYSPDSGASRPFSLMRSHLKKRHMGLAVTHVIQEIV